MKKMTKYQLAEIERLRRRFPSASDETLRYHVMTDAQRAFYWIDQTLKTVALFGALIGAIILILSIA
jgi:hypothetical protein